MRTSFLFICCFLSTVSFAQPNWAAIKANATFQIPDTNYYSPELLPIRVGGWEDGLYITRDGKHLFSTYIPVDITSWLNDFAPCIDFNPYYRPPLLGIDTVTNPFGCNNYIHSDIVKTERNSINDNFNPWHSSNLQTPVTFEGGACGVLNATQDSFDVFVFTQDNGVTATDIMLLQNVGLNPDPSQAQSILVTSGMEDNPHIERLENGDLLLLFDRDRYMHYTLSSDNGQTWQTPVQITQVLNDQAPYDVQPHLWNDGTDWCVYFSADNANGVRCIYKSKQLIANNWDSWGTRELVVEPNFVIDTLGYIYGVGEPTLTAAGDLAFVVVYGNHNSTDTTDVFDCDPWLLKRKTPIQTSVQKNLAETKVWSFYPNPAKETIQFSGIEGIESISIYNALGQLVKVVRLQNSTKNLEMDVSNWPSGSYFLKPDNNTYAVQKLMIVD